MKNLKELDIFKQNPDNKITGEAIENPPQDIPVYLIHDIFFGESLKLYTDPAQPENSVLVLNQDYICAQEDSIATEQAEKDCFRAVIFKAAYTKVYADYWVYGDTVSAKAYNDVVNIAAESSEKVDTLEVQFADLVKKTKEHIEATGVHEASADIAPDRIVMRTADGTIRTAPANEDTDVVPYSMLKTVDSKVDTALSKIKTEETLRLADIQAVTEKITAQTQAVSAADFLPDEFDWDTADEIQKEAARQALNVHIQKTDAYHNVLRNQNGSIIVPTAQTDLEAVNRKTVVDTVNARIASLIDNAPEELDTLKELADALKNNQSGIAAINTALSNRYTKQETDEKFIRQEPGKGLSSNDYTTEEKQKLASINVQSGGLSATDIIIKILQNGYIQWPGMPTPEAAGLNFPGYRWAEVDYNGAFFRAKGSGALPFDGGEQGDAIRNITGSFIHGFGLTANGCFSKAPTALLGAGNAGLASGLLYFNASDVVPTADENRPRNRTIVIWRLQKI